MRKPQDDSESILVAAVENPQERCFEAAERFSFSLGQSDLCDIGMTIKALGDEESEADVRKLFEREDLF